MYGTVSDENGKQVLQICHGTVIPEYSSAYALRCVRYLEKWPSRSIISVGGLIFRDQSLGKISQYRSLILTVFAIIKGKRSLEILLSKGTFLRRRYYKTLQDAAERFDIIILEGPWQYPLIRGRVKGKIVVYDAHNVECVLRKENKWKEYVKNIEAELCERADLIITVTENDLEEFQSLFNIPRSKMISIPEGFERGKLTWSGWDSNEIIFIGSAYLPNINAAMQVLRLARELPQFKFKIIGSVCSTLKKGGIPNNVSLLGTVDENRKSLELSKSLLALNPVDVGSGRNLKINDYVSHGVPLITTEVGSRGFEKELKESFIIVPLEEFREKILELKDSKHKLMSLSTDFLNYAVSYDYGHTQDAAYQAISKLVNTR